MTLIRRSIGLLLAGLLLFSSSAIAASLFPSSGLEIARQSSQLATISVRQLPLEARKTLDLIQKGGPFPYSKDGTTFGNLERILPRQPRGYYREYTVPTPGAKNRGARRIVTGQGGEIYYTDDHYQTFARVKL